jgi:hypothetical protein
MPAPPKSAADVAQHIQLSKEAQKLLDPTLLPRPYLELLIAHQQYQDAALFMAHAMPRREGVWWACLCARQAYGPTPPAKEAPVLPLAEKWVVQTTDENRRSTFKAAESAEFNNPAGLIGMAVFFSAGSIAPAGLTEVPPPPHLSPNALGNAVILSTVLTEPRKASERYLQFFALGFDVANGKNRWKEK